MMSSVDLAFIVLGFGGLIATLFYVVRAWRWRAMRAMADAEIAFRAEGRLSPSDSPLMRDAEAQAAREELEPVPEFRGGVSGSWWHRSNRVPQLPAGAGQLTLDAGLVETQERLRTGEAALRAAGYVPWRAQPPPLGTWIEAVHDGRADNALVHQVDGRTPGRVRDLLWRQTTQPIPVIVPEPTAPRDDGDAAPSYDTCGRSTIPQISRNV